MSVNFNLIISDIYVCVCVVFIFNSTHTHIQKYASNFGFCFLFLTVGANSVLVWCLMCVWMFQLIKSNSMNWWLRSTLKKKNFDNKMMIVVVVLFLIFHSGINRFFFSFLIHSPGKIAQKQKMNFGKKKKNKMKLKI